MHIDIMGVERMGRGATGMRERGRSAAAAAPARTATDTGRGHDPKITLSRDKSFFRNAATANSPPTAL